MTGKTHLMGGTLTGLCWMNATPPNSYAEMGVMLGTTALGSLLPDIDHHNSKITHANIITGIIGGIVSRTFKHRQEVHTLLACVIFGILGFLGMKVCGEGITLLINQIGFSLKVDTTMYAMTAGIGCFLGSVNHLMWDTFNPQGIWWLYPKKDRISICFIQTGSIFEAAFFAINTVLVCIFVYILWVRGIWLC